MLCGSRFKFKRELMQKNTVQSKIGKPGKLVIFRQCQGRAGIVKEFFKAFIIIREKPMKTN